MAIAPPSSPHRSAAAAESRRIRRERILDVLRTIAINLLYTGLVLVVGYSLLVTYRLKRYETAQKRAEVEAARAHLARDVEINEELKHEIRFLRTEDGVEKVAREKLGLIRPHESTYVIVNAPAPRPFPRVRPSPLSTPPGPTSESLAVTAWKALEELWNGGD
jgi:cell division protein FtsB